MAAAEEAAGRTEPIRIRARLKGGVLDVRALMPHPMETGMRKDDAGRLIAAHYITDVEVTLAGRPVFLARIGMAVSQDPLIGFRCSGAHPGDRIAVTWLDNRGQRRRDEALVVSDDPGPA